MTCRSAASGLSQQVDAAPRPAVCVPSHHSTKTAIVKVLGDILKALDGSDLTMLMLLDLSAAFDTVDHAIIMLRRL